MSDDFTGISTAARLCQIAGVQASTRAKWREPAELRHAPPYRERDLIELMVYAEVAHRLKHRALVAWLQLKNPLRELTFASRVDLVWDCDARTATLLGDENDVLAQHVRTGNHFRIIKLREVIDQARELYQRERTLIATFERPATASQDDEASSNSEAG